MRQPYQNQKGGQKRESMKKLNEFMDTVAGGDFETIIREFLEKKSKQEGQREKSMKLLGLLQGWKPLRTMIQGLKAMCSHKPTYLWREVISIVVDSGFSRKMVKNLGWNIGPDGASTSI